MKKIVLISALLTLTILFSCKEEEKKTSEPTQMEQVMAVHDEVMPKMGTIGKLVGELKSKVDTTAAGREYEQAMRDLQKANQSMMDWMQSFGNRFDSEEILEGKELTEQKQKWLDEEEENVKALKEEINSSIAKAKTLLGKAN
ncbi:protein kinase family protein [Costertonia aggregata]|uniref:Viral A-type inclusion protein n=1 Tax=Costertonia aggregata TaxID=343403 RepID=A0A7H9AQ99_9FLAO|nr:hypothetical protein [Costertonia aggregata]QLG45618.1 hypothetical protein HYG79_09750 [Costertonia aggregata]